MIDDLSTKFKLADLGRRRAFLAELVESIELGPKRGSKKWRRTLAFNTRLGPFVTVLGMASPGGVKQNPTLSVDAVCHQRGGLRRVA